MSISVDSRFTIHFCSTECPQSFIQQVEADNWVRSVTVHPGHLSFQSHSMFPGQTAAVAVVSLSASDKLRCRTLELVMVSKWLSGTHPRCRSDSLVPSTQSGKEKETDIKKLNAVSLLFYRSIQRKVAWWSYGRCSVDALELHQLSPTTAHRAAGRHMLEYTASVQSLWGQKKRKVSEQDL